MTERMKGHLTFDNLVKMIFVAIAIWVGTTSQASAKNVAVLNSQVGVILKTIEQMPTEREVELMIKVAILEDAVSKQRE